MHIVQLTLANSSVTNKSTHSLSCREAPTEMVSCRTRDATNADTYPVIQSIYKDTATRIAKMSHLKFHIVQLLSLSLSLQDAESTKMRISTNQLGLRTKRKEKFESRITSCMTAMYIQTDNRPTLPCKISIQGCV
jgi:hypothetical protein